MQFPFPIAEKQTGFELYFTLSIDFLFEK